MISFYVFEIGTAKECFILSKHWHKRCESTSHRMIATRNVGKWRELLMDYVTRVWVGLLNATAFFINVQWTTWHSSKIQKHLLVQRPRHCPSIAPSSFLHLCAQWPDNLHLLCQCVLKELQSFAVPISKT